MANNLTDKSTKPSFDQIITNVQNQRNAFIAELLKESNLTEFIKDHYEVFQVSSVRKEFMLRDLVELKNTPLDLVHYASLIKYLKESGRVIMGDNRLFIEELRKVFRKYHL